MPRMETYVGMYREQDTHLLFKLESRQWPLILLYERPGRPLYLPSRRTRSCLLSLRFRSE